MQQVLAQAMPDSSPSSHSVDASVPPVAPPSVAPHARESRRWHAIWSAVARGSSVLEGTVKTIMFASQAPPTAHLIALSRGDEQQTSYLSQLQVWHDRLYPVARETTVKRKQRRDAGVSRVPVPASAGPVAASAAPMSEAAFGRKREAAIANAVASSPSKRARVAPRYELGSAS